MDFRDIPDIKISEEQRRKNEAEVRKFLEKHDRAVERRIKKLRKAGYSDDEIENLFAF
ncbi:hypothetical protein GF325_07370 [Candidatus Bathyarchaeota archaeon]|nr:hypothetical protein [Candidatus Bathyarchaeota archaeon]